MKSRRLIFLTFLLLLVIVLPSVQARQDQPTPIQYGATVKGKVVKDSTVMYIFEGNAGDNLSIETASPTVDTYLAIADTSANILAENDDISQDNVNARVDYTLPANGSYLIIVYGYASGSFSLTLTQTKSPVVAQVDTGPRGDTFVGDITEDNFYAEYPITVQEGDTIVADARATSGDLDLYIVLFYNEEIVAENDDRETGTSDSLLEYPNAPAGDYAVVVTRFGFDKGATSGAFQVGIQIAPANQTLTGGSTDPIGPVNPTASGYPTMNISTTADWTLLIYMGGDNNLEDGLLNDMDEFEQAGGSTEKVRILVLMDRSNDYDTSNGDWTGTQVFEIGPDTSGDAAFSYPPTLDTQPLADLGELDTSYGGNLADFLVWGIQNYPAKHYAVAINNHGGAWSGMVTDETTGSGAILSVPEMHDAFNTALKTTGLSKFDLLINDACLMSSVEYYASVAPDFDFVFSSPEITLNPSFDMTLLTQTLNDNPNIDMGQLGELLMNKYLDDMTSGAPDTAPVLGGAVTDLRKFSEVLDSLDRFTSIVNADPGAYSSLIGKARSNTYAYSAFLPEDEFGPATNIDLGSFMKRIVTASNDSDLTAAAQSVLVALDSVRMYGTAGNQLQKQTTFYNIYFPASLSDANGEYIDQSPLANWTQMLSNYYRGVSPTRLRAVGKPAASPIPTLAPSIPPTVTITNIFPQETSTALPTTVYMEVVGRNIAHGDFTVDQIQPDGSAIRLDRSRIVTRVINDDGFVDFVNQWDPGVDDNFFTWDVTLPVVTDGETSSNELVTTSDNITSLAGRYRYPNSENWIDVTVMFDDDGNTENVISQRPGSTAVASVRLQPGGEFQTYRSVVTRDGRITAQPGTAYKWPANGVRFAYQPAPSGQYKLGFLIESAGGLSGFASTTLTVNNANINPTLRGYVNTAWGFTFQRPVDWYSVSYFPDSLFWQSASTDRSQYMLVYPVYDAASSDLKTIAQDALSRYDISLDTATFKRLTIAGEPALEFEFSYETSDGLFNGRAFVVYRPDLQLGLVFSAETLQGTDNTTAYQLFLDTVNFFDANAFEQQDTGLWRSDSYTKETAFPVKANWLPGFESGLWWVYTPDGTPDNPTFAAVTVLVETDRVASQVLNDLLESEVSTKQGYQLISTDTYYGDAHTWQVATYTHTPGQETVGRMFAMVINNVPYLMWFEAPLKDADKLFTETYNPMLEGFLVELPTAS